MIINCLGIPEPMDQWTKLSFFNELNVWFIPNSNRTRLFFILIVSRLTFILFIWYECFRRNVVVSRARGAQWNAPWHNKFCFSSTDCFFPIHYRNHSHNHDEEPREWKGLIRESHKFPAIVPDTDPPLYLSKSSRLRHLSRRRRLRRCSPFIGRFSQPPCLIIYQEIPSE